MEKLKFRRLRDARVRSSLEPPTQSRNLVRGLPILVEAPRRASLGFFEPLRGALAHSNGQRPLRDRGRPARAHTHTRDSRPLDVGRVQK